jgi:hypothetical protein
MFCASTDDGKRDSRVGVVHVHAYFNTAWCLAARDRCWGSEIGGNYLLVVAYLVHHTDR